MTRPIPAVLRDAAAPLRLPVAAALIVLGVVRVLLSVARSCQELACDDFGRFWYASYGWLHAGRSLYALTPASLAGDGIYTSNLNLPHTHLLFMPFTLLSRDVGAAAWFTVGLAAVVWTARIVATETGWRPTAAWFLVFIWWMPTHVQAVTGQVAWVMLPLLAGAWQSARRDRWTRAGAFIGAAIALKPFLVPLLAWLAWRRRNDAVVVACGCIVMTCALGVAIFGCSAYAQWRQGVSLIDWYFRSLNASVWGVTYRVFQENLQFAPLVSLGRMIPWVTVGLTAVVAALTWRSCRSTDDVDRQWSMVLCASLLLSPLGWIYYGVWLLPGLGFRWPGVFATAAWLVPMPLLTAGQPSRIATLLWGSAATWGLVLAFVHILRSPDGMAARNRVVRRVG